MNGLSALAVGSLYSMEFVVLGTLGAAALTLVVNACFAWAVYKDAEGFGGRLGFVSPPIWGAATLLGGVLVAAAYWLMHHSNLRDPHRDSRATPADATPSDH